MKKINKNFRVLMIFSLLGIWAMILGCTENLHDWDVQDFEAGIVDATLSTTSIESGGVITFTDVSTKVKSRKWSFPNGTSESTDAAVVDVTFVNPSTEPMDVDVFLTVVHTDNRRVSKSFTVSLGEGEAAGGTPFQPISIAFVTDDVTSDQGYIDLLVGKGHTVEAEAGKYNNLDATGASLLNNFDLVIISRNTNSGNFSDGARGAWTTVAVPVLNLSSYVARSTRLQFLNSANQNEGGGTSILATDATHPVFANVPLENDGTVAVTAVDLHVVVGSDAGNGTMIGTTADGANAAIAYFEANTAAYSGGEVFPSNRMFLSGTGGGFTYNSAGARLFLNCVEFVVTGSVYTIPSKTLSVAFVSDDMTSDQGYIDLLEGKGHTVEAEAGKYNNLTNALASELNNFDLVIISRSTNSGNFSDGARPAWTTVTAPVLNLSSYVARSTRLQFINSANQNEGGGTTILATDKAHVLFTQVAPASDGSLEVTAGDLHVVVGSDAGNGTMVGTTSDGANAAIAVFDANTAAYSGGEVFPSKRIFLAGTGGGFTYNEAGSQLFLNCVDYITN
ncbi:MAG: hypothetical protein JXQ96_01520 [Cyclobacteriaceae bacterium]